MGAAAGLGLLSCAALVLTAGRSARVPGAAPSSSWLGLLGPMRSPMPSATLAGIEIGAVLLLVLAWWWLLRGARRWPVRRLELVGLLWAAPLAMGPPLLSLDAYSYLAQGRLAALGIDPYQHAPSTLGPGVWLRGVDPFWRDALSPYGPLAVLLERASTLPGSPVAALVLLHLLALGALVVLALVVRRLAPSAQRGTVLLLVVVNPLVLLQLLGAAHWEALLVALLALALLAWQRDHPAAALALASTAAAVKLPAAFAVGVFLVLQVLAAGRTRRLQTAATGVAAATAPWLLLSLVVPNALGFAGALSTPLTGRTLYAPTTLLAEAMAKAGALTGGAAHFDSTLSLFRGGGLLLALGVCCVLLVTAGRRPAGTTIGIGLLVVALLGPVLYPWYCTWGLVPLALSSPRHRRLIVLLLSTATFTALPGCAQLGLALLAHGPVAAGFGAALLAAGTWALHRRCAVLRPPSAHELGVQQDALTCQAWDAQSADPVQEPALRPGAGSRRGASCTGSDHGDPDSGTAHPPGQGTGAAGQGNAVPLGAGHGPHRGDVLACGLER